MKQTNSFEKNFKVKINFIRRIYKEFFLPKIIFFSILFFVPYYLLSDIISDDNPIKKVTTYGYYVAFLLCLIVLMGIIVEKKTPELKILLLYIVWVLISRFLLGDFSFQSVNHLCRWGILFCCFFASGICLNQKQTNLLFQLVTLELVAILSVVAVIAIPTGLVGHSVLGIENISMGVEYIEPPLVYVQFLGVSRNISATYFICAMGLLLYQCIRSQNKIWKKISAIFFPLSYFTLVFQHSRSNYLAFAVVLSLALLGVLKDKIRWLTGLKGIVSGLCMLVICTLLTYESFSFCSNSLMNVSHVLRSNTATTEEITDAVGKEITDSAGRREQTSSEVTGESQTQKTQTLQIADERNTWKDALTLTFRTYIWMAMIPAIKDEPRIALIGQQESAMMDTINKRIVLEHPHMHNALFQQLMLTGIPGFLLYCLFFLSILKKAYLCFFCQKGTNVRTLRILAAILIGMMIYGMFEPLMYHWLSVSSMMFCLIAGLFIRDFNELSD